MSDCMQKGTKVAMSDDSDENVIFTESRFCKKQ